MVRFDERRIGCASMEWYVVCFYTLLCQDRVSLAFANGSVASKSNNFPSEEKIKALPRDYASFFETLTLQRLSLVKITAAKRRKLPLEIQIRLVSPAKIKHPAKIRKVTLKIRIRLVGPFQTVLALIFLALHHL